MTSQSGTQSATYINVWIRGRFFNITLETDDIIDFSSFKKGIDILKKYIVNF